MCGIGGFQGRFGAELIGTLTDAMAHRGPDGHGKAFFCEADGVATGFAHRRLAIIDLSDEGLQPMGVRCTCGGGATANDGLSLIYNGEIYNYRELRDELISRGHTFHSHTDSEVLLHLYAEQGTSMVSRLNGIFAFAIRDGRERGRPEGIEQGDVFIARCPLGVKPLYYAVTDRGVLFASEIKALLATRQVPREIDRVALHHYLAYLWTPAPRTMLRAVRKLPPGSAMILRGGRIARQWTYYELPHPEQMRDSEAAIADMLYAKLDEAVHRQMVSDVPVGAFLSGGLDSSSVVHFMRRHAAETPTCYCIGFEDARHESGPADLPYAQRVARKLGVKLETIVVTPAIASELERTIAILEEPQADPAPINSLLIAERARRDGYKVLLSGAGGDDIFSGYRRHRALMLEKYWTWLPRPARHGLASLARSAASGDGIGGMHMDSVRRAVKAFTYADLPDDSRMASYFWWSTDQLRRSLYSPALADALAREDTAAPLRETLSTIPAGTQPLDRMLHLELRHFLADHNLNYTDKTGMAASIEVRVPLIDLELVQFAAAIPPRMKYRGSVGKAVFKRAMERALPREVIYRAKTGFGAPLRRWLTTELRPLVDDVLSIEAIDRRGLFSADAVRRLVALDRAGRVDGSYTVFSLLCLELWCRRFIDAAA